ncbi:hypothetical protein [Pedobacter cryoconitis]|uniref:Uncharacterized protein n=1 Tax=Pedobacter cryoconitis TaxID=188932 RepID=A0A7X0IZM8_9SPHI|nr:hypothetical protein [Pedobacter cryoconitis]MBB6498359.1 hypothetical protein [Pedobacter cryoconitis]
MTEVKETGGARIGMANATWPFATLTVNNEKLQLNATILGNLIFKPGDIISIVPYSGLMSSGLKINHNVPGYNDNVVFWTFSSPNEIIKKIEATGFLTNTIPLPADLEERITKTQSQGGFPLKTSAAIAIVVIWNILFLINFQNFFGESKVGPHLGLGPQLALGFMLLTCALLLTFEPARRLILKEGRTVDEIKKFIFFIMFICGFILLITVLVH